MNQKQRNRFLSFAMAAAVSVSAFPTPAIAANAIPQVSIQSFSDSAAINGMVYGTVNMPYADFYYGELNDIGADTSATPDLAATDPIESSGYRNAGQYDAVSSCTTTKSKRFEATYYEEAASGVDILGIQQVQVAVPEELYYNTKTAMESGQTCNNPLYHYIETMTVSKEAFSEYKVLTANGTFSKMVSGKKTAAEASASITTSSRWGDYQINISNIDVAANDMLGAVIETTDGKKYGLKHLENLWLKTAEIAFAVEAFVEPHGNTVSYQRYEDIQGKTISKITYLIKNGDDIEINTNLFVKYQTAANTSIALEDIKQSSSGMSSKLTLNTPDVSSYGISSITYGKETLDTSLYQLKDDTLFLDESCKPGSYTVTFTDTKYEDITTTFVVHSNLEADDISITNNKLAINGNAASLTEYLNGITGVEVDGVTINGSNLGTAIFNEDGTINFDAVVINRGNSQAVFSDGVKKDYTLSITATGYPSIETKVGQSYVKTPASALTIALNANTFTYNGKVQKPSVIVKATSGTIVAPENYTLSYSGESKLSGRYSVTINFKNQYTGSQTYCYSIKPVSISSLKLKLNTTSFTYNGKIRKPSIIVKDKAGYVVAAQNYTLAYSKGSKLPGRYSVTVSFKNQYTGSQTYYYNIKPAKTTLKIASASKKNMKLTWKKAAGVNGYQIQYSTSSKFKGAKSLSVSSNTAAKTINKLSKNKKYFVRIRSYKKIKENKKNTYLYSSWSTVRNIKTKK